LNAENQRNGYCSARKNRRELFGFLGDAETEARRNWEKGTGLRAGVRVEQAFGSAQARSQGKTVKKSAASNSFHAGNHAACDSLYGRECSNAQSRSTGPA